MGSVFLALPFIALAQTTITSILDKIGDILAVVIRILIVIATLVFIYGLVTYLLSTGDEEKRKEARQVMIWGIIILFVIVVVWGLVAVLENTFNVNRENIPAGPRMIEPRPE